MLREYFVLDMAENLIESGYPFSPEHSYAGIAEMRYAFEQRGSCKMAPDMEYAAVFIYASHTLSNLATEQ